MVFEEKLFFRAKCRKTKGDFESVDKQQECFGLG
jgi:hypothetical protein